MDIHRLTEQCAGVSLFHLAPNGKVLVVGGSNRADLKTAEIYDPATGTWAATGSLSASERYQTATLLANGKVMVIGAASFAGSDVAATTELYDPDAGTWTLTSSPAEPRTGHAATLLSDNTVLVTGGNGHEVIMGFEKHFRDLQSCDRNLEFRRFSFHCPGQPYGESLGGRTSRDRRRPRHSAGRKLH